MMYSTQSYWFLDLFHRPVFSRVETRRFGNCISLNLQVTEEEDTHLGPFERVNLNYCSDFLYTVNAKFIKVKFIKLYKYLYSDLRSLEVELPSLVSSDSGSNPAEVFEFREQVLREGL
jgi:hypothetical protein